MSPKANPDTLKTAPKGPQDGPRWAPRRSFRSSQGSKVMRPFSYTNGRITFGPVRHPSPRADQRKTTKNTQILQFCLCFFLVASKGPPRRLQERPRAPRERPRRAPGGSFQGCGGVGHNSDHPFFDRLPQERPSRSPRGPQESPKSGLRESERLPK